MWSDIMVLDILYFILVQLCTSRNVVINHQKMKLFFAFFFMNSTEEHTARVNAHHRSRWKNCNSFFDFGTATHSLTFILEKSIFSDSFFTFFQVLQKLYYLHHFSYLHHLMTSLSGIFLIAKLTLVYPCKPLENGLSRILYTWILLDVFLTFVCPKDVIRLKIRLFILRHVLPCQTLQY